ncbi:MAG: hypothetical protein ACE5HV_00670 [Acidobacteriota bacterium]
MKDEIRVKFLICSACDRVFRVADLTLHVHEFDSDDGSLLVVHDYHCPSCQAKLASWGTR